MKSSKNAISSHVCLKVFHLESEEIQNNMVYRAEEMIPFFSWVLFLSYSGQLGPWRNVSSLIISGV